MIGRILTTVESGQRVLDAFNTLLRITAIIGFLVIAWQFNAKIDRAIQSVDQIKVAVTDSADQVRAAAAGAKDRAAGAASAASEGVLSVRQRLQDEWNAVGTEGQD